MKRVSLATGLLFASVLAGCRDSEPPTAEARTPLIYEPNPVFQTLPCSDAQELVLWDLGREDRAMARNEIEAYARALKSRYDACAGEEKYVSVYLQILQAVGWSGIYNSVVADKRFEWPNGRPEALPESTLVPTRTEP